QNRETRGAARLIRLGQGGRIEVGADQSRRRARLLDLGDQRVVAGRDAPLDRFQKAARRGGRLRGRFDHRIGALALGRGDLLALVGLDLFQDVGHCAFETLIRRCSRPSASPLSSDFAAIAAPSFRSLALPATIKAAAAFSTAMSRYGPLLPLSTAV